MGEVNLKNIKYNKNTNIAINIENTNISKQSNKGFTMV